MADREEGFVPTESISFRHLVPLAEIIAEVLNQGVDTKGVEERYRRLVHRLGGELKVLLEVPEDELSLTASPEIVEGIMRVREGKVRVRCGYDGVYGKVSILDGKKEKGEGQLSLF